MYMELFLSFLEDHPTAIYKMLGLFEIKGATVLLIIVGIISPILNFLSRYQGEIA